MQGTLSPEAAAVVAIICVGLAFVYLPVRHAFGLLDKNEHERQNWLIWRFISGMGCVALFFIGFSILMAMTNDFYVLKFCQANGLNSIAVMLVLFAVSTASAVLNVFMHDQQSTLRSTVKI